MSESSETILRRKAVESRVGLSRASLYSYIARGLFPAPIKLGERAVGWKISQIDHWIATRPESKGGKAVP